MQQYFVISFIMILGLFLMVNSINYSDKMNSSNSDKMNNDCEDTLLLSRANNGILVIGSMLVTASLFMLIESRKNGGFNMKIYNWILLLLSIALITLGAIVHIENDKKKCKIKGVASVWITGTVLFVLIASSMGLVPNEKNQVENFNF